MKIALIATLFVPGFVTLKNSSRQSSSTDVNNHRVPLAEEPRRKEFVKLYAIVKSNRPDISDAEVWQMSDAIHQESVKHDLDPILVAALIQVESGFKRKAVSPMGARGVMQIMPGVAQGLAQESGLRGESDGPRFKPENLDDPVFSIKLGVYYLNDLKKSFRDLHKALIAYNLGPTELKNRLQNNREFSAEFAMTVLDTYQKLRTTEHPIF